MAISEAQISLHEAIEQMSGIPEGEQPVNEPDQEGQALTEQAELESESDIDPDEQPREGEGALEADSEDVDDGESDDEQQGADEAEGTPGFTVEIDGTEIEVTPESYRKVHLLHADYTRKTQETAERNKVLDAEAGRLSDRMEQLDQEYAAIQDLLVGAKPEMPPVEWIHSKPADYEAQSRAVKEWEALNGNLAQFRQKIQAERSETAAKERQELIQTEAKKLVHAFELKDQAEFMAKTGEIQAYLLSQGYDQIRLSGMLDHRDYIIADKARKYDELMAKGGQKAALKVQNAKVKSSGASAPKKPVSRVKKAKQRLDRVTGPSSKFSRNQQLEAVLDAMEG